MATYCPDKRGPALYPDCRECDQKNCKRFFCLVTGTDIGDYELMKQKLGHLLKNHSGNVAIVSGGTDAVSCLAERYARENDYPYYGFSIGEDGREELHRFISRFQKKGVVIFWNGKNRDMAESLVLSEKYKTRAVTVRYHEAEITEEDLWQR